MEKEQKDKLKQGAKIVGKAGWSALKGAVKFGARMGVSEGLSTVGDRMGADYLGREAGKKTGDFRKAAEQLKELKNLGKENPEDNEGNV